MDECSRHTYRWTNRAEAQQKHETRLETSWWWDFWRTHIYANKCRTAKRRNMENESCCHSVWTTFGRTPPLPFLFSATLRAPVFVRGLSSHRSYQRLWSGTYMELPLWSYEVINYIYKWIAPMVLPSKHGYSPPQGDPWDPHRPHRSMCLRTSLASNPLWPKASAVLPQRDTQNPGVLWCFASPRWDHGRRLLSLWVAFLFNDGSKYGVRVLWMSLSQWASTRGLSLSTVKWCKMQGAEVRFRVCVGRKSRN